MAMNSEENETAVKRLELVRSRIATATFHRKQSSSDVTLIAVGKGHSGDKIRELYAIGLRDFAENYAQEYLKKREELSDLADIRWHFIGHLQTNKAKKVAQTGCLIHGLDRMSLLDELLKSAQPSSPTKVLLQLQVDPNDANKSGCTFEEAAVLCAKIAVSPGLLWEGFTGMGPADCPPESLRMMYEKFMFNASRLWEEYSLRDPSRQLRPMKISLGMSDDLEIAVRCGSNHVRIGSALFGPRPNKSQAT
jgi:pyridoxal phosphate enzyme (YggS family)